MTTLPKCELRKRWEWCGDIEPSCSTLIDKFGLDVEASEVYCKIFSLNLVPKFRYLKYVDNLARLQDTTTEQLIFLKQCGFSMKETAELLNGAEQNVKARFADLGRRVEEKRDLIASTVALGTENTLRSLESKWAQLNEMRNSTDEEIQLRAIKLQIEVEMLINDEKDKMLTMEKLRRFMALMEEKVIRADARLKVEISDANRYLTAAGSTRKIEYVSIIREVRRAIEMDKELTETSDALSNHHVIDLSTQRTLEVSDT